MKLYFALAVSLTLLQVSSAFLSPIHPTSNAKFSLIQSQQLHMVSKELTKEPTTSNTSDDRICKETKTIVITGASQGLGQAMAYEFVRLRVAKYSLMKSL